MMKNVISILLVQEQTLSVSMRCMMNLMMEINCTTSGSKGIDRDVSECIMVTKTG